MIAKKPQAQLLQYKRLLSTRKPKPKRFLSRAKGIALGVALGSALAGTAFVGATKYLQAKKPVLKATRPIATRQIPVEAKPRILLEAQQKKFTAFSSESKIVLLPGEQQVSASVIETELHKANSPAIGLGKAFVDYGNAFGIKASVAIAFFRKESGFGKQGLAAQTKSIGNIRFSPPKKNGVQYSNYNGFRQYASWEDGLKDFYDYLSSSRYSGKTLEQALSIYAPASENNTGKYVKQTVNYVNHLQASSG